MSDPAVGGLVERVQRRLAAAGPVAGGAGGLRSAVAGALREEGILLPPPSLAATVRAISDELTGLGPLAPLLADPNVIGSVGYWNLRNSSGKSQPRYVRVERSSCT